MPFLSRSIKRPFGRRPARTDLNTLVRYIRAELERQDSVATDRLQQPFFTDICTGRNMGRDELLALAYLRDVQIDPLEEDHGDPATYLERVLGEVRTAKQHFAKEEEDPEGFGVGTFSEIIRKLEGWLADGAN